jgi:hypothetical protein
VNATPETDNLARGNHVVPTEFAQDLERQLRKARDWVFRLRKHRAIARNFGEQMERERDNLTDQRDFAMEVIKRLERERDHWKSESLEQAKLLAMSGDREEKLRDALKYVAGPDTSQDASPQQCSAVLVAMEALQ